MGLTASNLTFFLRSLCSLLILVASGGNARTFPHLAIANLVERLGKERGLLAVYKWALYLLQKDISSSHY